MTVHLISTVYGRVLVHDTEIGFRSIAGSGTYADEHIHMVRIANMLRERPRGVVVDAGANYGFWSIAMAQFADQVVAIEPQRGIYHMLCGTVAINNLSYVVFPHMVALGDAPGSTEIAVLDYGREGMFGGLSMGGEPSPEECVAPFKVLGAEPVRVERLSGCLDPIQRVSFIKMDIEGGEAAALRGAVTTIRRWRPIMFVEHSHARTDKDHLRGWIEDHGYDVEDVPRNFLCVPK